MPIDIRSPETAYADKPNIVRPGSVAQNAAAEERAALHQELNQPTTPTTRARVTNVVTETKLIKRET